MKRILLSLCAVIATVGPSASQPKKVEPAFFIILNSLTKKCTVAEKIPQPIRPT